MSNIRHSIKLLGLYVFDTPNPIHTIQNHIWCNMYICFFYIFMFKMYGQSKHHLSVTNVRARWTQNHLGSRWKRVYCDRTIIFSAVSCNSMWHISWANMESKFIGTERSDQITDQRNLGIGQIWFRDKHKNNINSRSMLRKKRNEMWWQIDALWDWGWNFAVYASLVFEKCDTIRLMCYTGLLYLMFIIWQYVAN